MMLEAYEDKQIDGWKQTRMIAYLIYCSATSSDKREAKSEYEFFQLPGDPTKEEIEKIKLDDIDKRYKRIMEMTRQVGSQEAIVNN